MLVPPDRVDEFARTRQSLDTGEPVAPFETVRLTKDGQRLDVSIAVSPLTNADGVLVGTSIITRDISERRRAQEQQNLLLAELSHRVKNTLATVLSIANQTLSRAESLDEFSRSFRGRIQALAAAHSVLTAVNWNVAALRVLVEQALQPYASSDGSNVRISGDEVLLRPSAALTFSLVLHELATNAAKYGALQKPGGLVAVDCGVRSNGGRELHLHWAESGGPPVRPPVRRGFGLELIERSVAHQLGGQAVLDYRVEGVVLRDHRTFDRQRRHLREWRSALRVKPTSIRRRPSCQVATLNLSVLLRVPAPECPRPRAAPHGISS